MGYWNKRAGVRRIFPDGFVLPGGAVASISGNLDVQSQATFGGIVITNGIELTNYEGIVSVASNATVATVSTTAVASDSNIQVTALQMVVASMFTVGISSRVDGVSFAVAIGAADAAVDHDIGWAILG